MGGKEKIEKDSWRRCVLHITLISTTKNKQQNPQVECKPLNTPHRTHRHQGAPGLGSSGLATEGSFKLRTLVTVTDPYPLCPPAFPSRRTEIRSFTHLHTPGHISRVPGQVESPRLNWRGSASSKYTNRQFITSTQLTTHAYHTNYTSHIVVVSLRRFSPPFSPRLFKTPKSQTKAPNKK